MGIKKFVILRWFQNRENYLCNYIQKLGPKYGFQTKLKVPKKSSFFGSNFWEELVTKVKLSHFEISTVDTGTIMIDPFEEK
jgi:hypothetical protein